MKCFNLAGVHPFGFSDIFKVDRDTLQRKNSMRLIESILFKLFTATSHLPTRIDDIL